MTNPLVSVTQDILSPINCDVLIKSGSKVHPEIIMFLVNRYGFDAPDEFSDARLIRHANYKELVLAD